MRFFTKIGLAAVLASSFAQGASSAPVTFTEDVNAPARQIINVVFAPYLQQRVGAVVQTATVDLDNDRVGEIVARFVHTGSCDAEMKKCRTVILRHRLHDWEIMLDRYASSVEILEEDSRTPSNIKVDDMTWRWRQHVYNPTTDGIGQEVSFQAVPETSKTALAAAFGEGAEKLVAAGRDLQLSFARPSLADEDTLLVKMEGETVCGDYTGCPVRLLKKNGDTWASILETYTTGGIYLSQGQRQGYRDIAVKTDPGFAVLGWNGHSYGIADRIEKVRR